MNKRHNKQAFPEKEIANKYGNICNLTGNQEIMNQSNERLAYMYQMTGKIQKVDISTGWQGLGKIKVFILSVLPFHLTVLIISQSTHMLSLCILH